jgi:hypothetical protein
MKIYTKPTVFVIVTSLEILDLGYSEGLGEGEFANTDTFEDEVLGTGKAHTDLWDED